ncbi:uncharacterized protein JCM6883_003279 [Sporobolomyces salmoneus]|uniref:uncharacterized protein n=1 Tax=Sporobolomyces salmoneus TaxID=183962 RepID=UPI00316DFE38
MAVRRLARQGLIWSEAPPIASTSTARSPCPGCRHSTSSALPLHPAHAARTHHSDDSHGTQTSSKQPSKSWAAISRASQALFAPTVQSTNSSSPPSSVQLVGAAAELVQELKLAKPDPHRVWTLFSQVDLQGLTHTLPLISLHALLPAIHLKPHHSPRKSSGFPLSIQASTNLARAYAVKVDLIRLRLRQAGAKAGPGDWNALIWQYHALRYAPGVTKIWDEMIEAGHLPSVPVCTRVFETMAGWIEMHGRASGKVVEGAAAQPLLKKAVSMMEDIAGDPKRMDAILDPFFSIIAKARDRKVLSTVVKQIYAFDIKLPGAHVELSEAQKAKTRTMGEQELCWVLEGLAELDDLSSMISVMEVFDRISTHPSSPDFFTQSFSTASSPSTSADKPHPVGTRAFTTLIQAASRLDSGPVVRHYFDLLFSRWALDSNSRISELEQAIGSVPAESDPLDSTGESAEILLEPTSSDSPSSPSPSSSTSSEVPQIDFNASLPVAHLAASPASPSRPYVVPSTLIGNIAHYSLHHHDLATARWIRLRTRRLLQLMESQAARINSVLNVLEPSRSTSPSTSTTSSPSTSNDTSASPPPRSLTLLERELALLGYHRQQVRLMLSSVKASSNIVRSMTELHRLQYSLGRRAKKLADPKLSKREIVRVRPGVRRKEQQVLLTRIVVLKHRLNKLYTLEGLRPGNWEYDRWANEIKELRKRADGQGLIAEEEGATTTTSTVAA